MGKALFYCYKCSSLLREDDLSRGKAVRVGDHVACTKCAPDLADPPKPPTRTGRLSSSTAMPSVPKKTPPPPVRRPAERPQKSPMPWIVGGIIAVLVLILAVIAMSGGDNRPPPPNEEPKAAPEASDARKALNAARRFAREHPDDLSGQLREFTSVALQHDGTPEGKEAMKEADRLKTETAARVSTGMAAVEKEIQPLLDKGDFAGAIRALEAAERRHAMSEWELAVRNRTAEVREMAFRNSAPTAELVGHWTFEEGSGQVTKDVSGHGRDGKLLGTAAWAEDGKKGKGIRFDGVNAWIDLNRDGLMDSIQKKSYTLALWFKPEGVPEGTGDQNNAAYGLLMKPGFHLGLAYNRWQRFYVCHWLEPRNDVGLTAEQDSPPNRFAHVACTVNRTLGTTELFVDGALQGSRSWKPDSEPKDYEGNPWRLGYAAPGVQVYSWPAKGVIDEVRMYSRALSDDEVRKLYLSGR